MTEQKKPQAGEWYQGTTYRAFVHAFTRRGSVMYEVDNGLIHQESPEAFLKNRRHLPDCTGWDWVEPDWVKLTDREHVLRKDVEVEK